jgi:FtsP/CotA-like multicopper oxidase with cupredoxin domain
MHNISMIAYPMHLHGHHFQIVAINETRINGAVRDNVTDCQCTRERKR